MNSSIVKVVAWIYVVLGAIGSLVMGNSAKEVFYGVDHINVIVTLIGLVSIAGTAFVLFAIAQIMENTEECMSRLYKVEHKPTGSAPTNASNSKMSLSAISSKPVGSEWTCPDCGKKNPTSVRTCKDCGYQK